MSIMTEFLIAAVALPVCIGIGWRIREIHAENVVKNYLKQQENASKVNPASVMTVDVEKRNDQYYVYNSENNSFLVQVTNKEQLMEYFTTKYPDKTILMSQEHLQLIENT